MSRPDPPDAFELSQALIAASTTSKRVVSDTLRRIQDFDKQGPQLNAVIELNRDAMSIAEALDAEREKGSERSALHGIPILIKDNVATADTMLTSAGSLALEVPVAADASIVKQLRDAGLVIVGKTNMSEWANFRSRRSISGWSARGGITRNPYCLDRNPDGSSSGSAVAVAAGYVPMAIGTETCGSIVLPASACGIVGLKPTVGLISTEGIIPVAPSVDVPGPMTRTVRDAALLLSILAAPNCGTDAPDVVRDYSRDLSRDGLTGVRLGVVRNLGEPPSVTSVFEEALKTLRSKGAVIVDPIILPDEADYKQERLCVLLHEFKPSLAQWLAQYVPDSRIKQLSDLLAWNEQHREKELALFGQDLFELSEQTKGLSAQEYLRARTVCQQMSSTNGFEKALTVHELDALIAPTAGPAWLTDFVLGDPQVFNFCAAAAFAGLPHLTVPSGFIYNLPVGLSFVGAAWAEHKLLQYGYAFEQASNVRRPPGFVETLGLPN